MLSSPAYDPADQSAAASAAHLAVEAGAVPLPSPVLGGWASLAAAEYTGAVIRLHRTLQAAAEAFRAAGGAA